MLLAYRFDLFLFLREPCRWYLYVVFDLVLFPVIQQNPRFWPNSSKLTFWSPKSKSPNLWKGHESNHQKGWLKTTKMVTWDPWPRRWRYRHQSRMLEMNIAILVMIKGVSVWRWGLVKLTYPETNILMWRFFNVIYKWDLGSLILKRSLYMKIYIRT